MSATLADEKSDAAILARYYQHHHYYSAMNAAASVNNGINNNNSNNYSRSFYLDYHHRNHNFNAVFNNNNDQTGDNQLPVNQNHHSAHNQDASQNDTPSSTSMSIMDGHLHGLATSMDSDGDTAKRKCEDGMYSSTLYPELAESTNSTSHSTVKSHSDSSGKV